MRDLTTPAFVVDRAAVQRNCDRMRDKARSSGVAFRPHVKTHKSVEIGRMQHGGSPGPVTVSTLAEAERFAAAGFVDITYAVPIGPGKLARAAALARQIERLNILIDSETMLRAVEESGHQFDGFLKVDCGTHRAGVDPDAPASLALALAALASPSLRLRGLLTHAGHAYDARSREDVLRAAAEETAAVSRFREAVGEPALVRSIGSTPTASAVERFEDCDEVRPGNYVFFDAFQSAIGSCSRSDIAVSVLTTVVGSYPERGALIVDAGALALSKDTGPGHVEPRSGYGIVCDAELNPLLLHLVSLSQEHGKITGGPALVASLGVGTLLRIVPNHSCLTAAMFDRYYVLDGGRVTGEWRPVRGW